MSDQDDIPEDDALTETQAGNTAQKHTTSPNVVETNASANPDEETEQRQFYAPDDLTNASRDIHRSGESEDFPLFGQREADPQEMLTRVAAVPEELIASLVEERDVRESLPNDPETSQDVQLDLDELVEGFEEPTRIFEPYQPESRLSETLDYQSQVLAALRAPEIEDDDEQADVITAEGPAINPVLAEERALRGENHEAQSHEEVSIDELLELDLDESELLDFSSPPALPEAGPRLPSVPPPLPTQARRTASVPPPLPTSIKRAGVGEEDLSSTAQNLPKSADLGRRTPQLRPEPSMELSFENAREDLDDAEESTAEQTTAEMEALDSLPAKETSEAEAPSLSVELQLDDDEPEIEALDDDEPEIETLDDDEPEIEALDDDEPEIEALDDDEPEIEALDDDEPEIEALDDDEPEIEALDDDDDWADIETVETEDTAAPKPVITSTSRKQRHETFPMVGGSAETLRLRQRLLTALADNSNGETRARLLASAAELAEKNRNAQDASALYAAAIEADPNDIVALRGRRNGLLRDEAWDDAADLLQREANLDCTHTEKVARLTYLAEILLHRCGRPQDAKAVLNEALTIVPNSAVARLLSMEVEDVLGQTASATECLNQLGTVVTQPKLSAHSRRQHVLALELQGRWDELSTEDDTADNPEHTLPTKLAAVRRIASRADDATAELDALKAAAITVSGPVANALRRRASLTAQLSLNDALQAHDILEGTDDLMGLRARAEAASATGDETRMRDSLRALADHAGGTERAMALVRIAEMDVSKGAYEAAEQALREAALADGSLATIRVVRELMVRQTGDISHLAKVGGSALSAAAKILTPNSALDAEAALLRDAQEQSEALITAEILQLDIAAATGDTEELTNALHRQVERSPLSTRIGALLVSAHHAKAQSTPARFRAHLEQVYALSPDNTFSIQQLARMMEADTPSEASALWEKAGSVSQGTRAAIAWTRAASLQHRSAEYALELSLRAVDADPAYLPALWDTLRYAHTVSDEDVIQNEILPRLGHADQPTLLQRLALLEAPSSTFPTNAADRESQSWQRLHALLPKDRVGRDWLLLQAHPERQHTLADELLNAAEQATGQTRRFLQLRAFEELSDQRRKTEAAQALRALLADDTDAHFGQTLLDDAEIAANEVARVAGRCFDAVRDAENPEAQIYALERLATLDRDQRNDPGSAALSLQSILEIDPTHIPSLRALQRYYAKQGRREELHQVVRMLAESLSEPAEVSAHLRLLHHMEFCDPRGTFSDADEVILAHAADAAPDLWLARRIFSIANTHQRRDIARQASQQIAEQLASPTERASTIMRTSEWVLHSHPKLAMTLLSQAAEEAPRHSLVLETLAGVLERERQDVRAAQVLEQAAKASRVHHRAAAFWYRAARIYQDRLEDPKKTRLALEQVAASNPLHGDVFERLRDLLRKEGKTQALFDLYEQRIRAGADATTLANLYLEHADLAETLEQPEAAKSALRAALALQPERIQALRRLAQIYLNDEDWRGAAETLIRIARLRQDRSELRWVFFTLGKIYDQYMPDVRRAEAAYRRVLKLVPHDVETLGRLADIYQRTDRLDEAATQLETLVELDGDPDENLNHRLKYAMLLEKLGRSDAAEATLEQARRVAPTEIRVVHAMGDFYRRQNSGAFAMHLNRALGDFRTAIQTDPNDGAAWSGLIQVLRWRGFEEAAASTASTMHAIGLMPGPEADGLLTDQHGAPGLPNAATSAMLDELLAPAMIRHGTYAVFDTIGAYLEDVHSFDLRRYRAKPLDAKYQAVRERLNAIAALFELPKPELYTTDLAPNVCAPVASRTPTILFGEALLDMLDESELDFVLFRSAKIIAAKLPVIVRAQPDEVGLLLAGLLNYYVPDQLPSGLDASLVRQTAERIAQLVPQDLLARTGPAVYEMLGNPNFSSLSLALTASEWGNRVALLACGNAPAAIRAIAKLSGEAEASQMAAVQRFTEAESLVEFSISAGYFDVLHRLRGA